MYQASMILRDPGGVDEELLAWGVKGLSIVDAGTMPIVPGTVAIMRVYANSEKGGR